jgi:hypothetical protein
MYECRVRAGHAPANFTTIKTWPRELLLYSSIHSVAAKGAGTDAFACHAGTGWRPFRLCLRTKCSRASRLICRHAWRGTAADRDRPVAREAKWQGPRGVEKLGGKRGCAGRVVESDRQRAAIGPGVVEDGTRDPEFRRKMTEVCASIARSSSSKKPRRWPNESRAMP